SAERRSFRTGTASNRIYCLHVRAQRYFSSREIAGNRCWFSKTRVAFSLTQPSERASLARGDFPCHKVVQRLPCLSDRKCQDNCIIGKTEAGNPIGDKIEWIQDVNDRTDDHHEILQRYVPVFAAVIGANQTQHRLEVRPKILERVSRYGRSFFYCFLKELT